jgi:hypothetical protein
MTHTGLFSWGLAGCLAGVHLASDSWPRLRGLEATYRSVLVEQVAAAPWLRDQVSWRDYDLITGPSGVLLALSIHAGCGTGSIQPIARHLAALCDADDLARFTVGAYKDEQLRGWNHGHVNTGLAHGVTGAMTALSKALEISGDDRYAFALGRLGCWLLGQAFVDGRGVVTWPSAGLGSRIRPREPSKRQAWCYGTPGVAWTLWEAGRLVQDAELQAFAIDAYRSFLAAYDDDFYLGGDVGFCHGAAGQMLIADAFARHVSLVECNDLRDHLDEYISSRLDEIVDAMTIDASLLSGSSGPLVALLTLHLDDRRWLPLIGLR